MGLFGKKRYDDDYDDDDDELEEDEDDREYVLFQGATNGRELDMKANARLAQVALLPTKQLITDGLEQRAHTIQLDPKGSRGAVCTYYVDGIPCKGDRYASQQMKALTQMIKLLAGMEPKERSRSSIGWYQCRISMM